MEPDITQPDGSKEDRLRDEEEDEGAQLVYDSRHELSFSCFIKHGGRMDIRHCSILKGDLFIVYCGWTIKELAGPPKIEPASHRL